MSYTTLTPNYMDGFQCKGSACQFTCCKEWEVTYSKSDYAKIRNIAKTPELKALVAGCVRRQKDASTAKQYARFEMDEHEACKMLDENGLCRLQMQCGHSVLPEVCRIFPRSKYVVENMACQSCEAVCEAVIEELFKLPDGISFIKEEKNGVLRGAFTKFISEEKFEQRPVYRYFWDIMTLSIDTLQSRNYSLDDRVIILGIIMKKLHQMETEGDLAGIPAYTQSMQRALSSGGLTAGLQSLTFNRMPVVANAQMNLSLLRINDKETERAVIDTISNNLKIFIRIHNTGEQYTDDESENPSFDLVLYDKAQALYREYMKSHEYVMENLLVNTFYSGAYPFNGDFTIWQSYVRFASIYALYKYAAAGVMLSDPSDQAFVHTITVLSRGLLRKSWFSKFIVDFTHHNQADSLAHIAIMIKS